MPFCPYHFVQYHFVRTILSATILYSHPQRRSQPSHGQKRRAAKTDTGQQSISFYLSSTPSFSLFLLLLLYHLILFQLFLSILFLSFLHLLCIFSSYFSFSFSLFTFSFLFLFTTPKFWDGCCGGTWGLHEILSNPTVYRNMK